MKAKGNEYGWQVVAKKKVRPPIEENSTEPKIVKKWKKDKVKKVWATEKNRNIKNMTKMPEEIIEKEYDDRNNYDPNFVKYEKYLHVCTFCVVISYLLWKFIFSKEYLNQTLAFEYSIGTT